MRHHRRRQTTVDSHLWESTPVSIDFDTPPPTMAIVFHPDWTKPTASGPALSWSHPVTPEVIDRVVEVIGSQSLPVEAIVIGGLDRYPLGIINWTRWLRRWSRGPGPRRIIVDTEGLGRRRRRRLIHGTRREIAMGRRSHPVATVADAVRRWIKERMR